VLLGDRTAGNMQEQSLPFLLALWLHAAFVPGGAHSAAPLGWAWLLARAMYPFVFARGVPALFVSTVPCYAVTVALLWPLARVVCNSSELPKIAGITEL